MSTTMLHGVEKLLARSNGPLNLVAHHEEIQRRALDPVGINDSDPILARDPANPILIKEAAASQKEYFRKIKFARLEQEAKRSFVFGITADDPPKADPAENEASRQVNVVKKAQLKAVKDDIENMKVRAVETARSNTKKQAALTERMTEAQSLYKQIKDMELEMQRMRAAHPVENRITIPQAEALVEQYEQEMIEQTTEAEEAKEEIEVVRAKASRAAKDIQRLAKDREREEARAKEVREGREAGDTRVDELCHWLSSSIAFYKTLLGIRTVTAINETTVQLEYDIPNRNPITLLLEYDPLSRRLVDASVLGVDMDFKECINLAVVSNDVPGLVADILNRLRR